MPTQALLVEDSRAMRDYVCAILEADGEFEVHAVENGFEALRSLPRERYGLIVTDIHVPDISGLEIVAYVRKMERHQGVPIVVISTDASEIDRTRALRVGADAFLAKPFTPDDLREVVARVRSSPRTPSGPNLAADGGRTPGDGAT
jgi:two-component system chemotaxis response regulator CheY